MSLNFTRSLFYYTAEDNYQKSISEGNYSMNRTVVMLFRKQAGDVYVPLLRGETKNELM